MSSSTSDPTPPGAWSAEIAEMEALQAAAEAMGGEDKVAAQRAKGKSTVRDRISGLLDPDSFHEIGALAGSADYDADGRRVRFTPSNLVSGRGRVDGRPVVVAGDDFTVRGGGADAAIHEKQIQAERMALDLRLPMIRLIDGSSGGGSVRTLEQSGRTYIPANPGWDAVTANLATVPVVSLGLGPVAGLGAARLVSAHYSLLLRDQGFMFAAGPAIVSALGAPVTKEELGGAEVHARSGAVDDLADDEADAFAKARRFLSYLPSSVDGLPPHVQSSDPPDRSDAWLDEAIPKDRRKVYDMRAIVRAVVDQDSFFEIGRAWGRASITGLARFAGWPVALIASDPRIYGGAWTPDTAEKLTRFIEFAETFHLPVVHLVDIPGVLIGVEAEQKGAIRKAARTLGSVYQATVPWCTVIVRKAYGVAAAGMMDHTRFRYRCAWPSGDWGSLPIEGGIEAAYKAELEAAEDREAARAEIEARLNAVRSPFRSAEKYLVEEIIRPRNTRRWLCEFAELAAPLRRPGPSSFGFRP